MKTSRPYKNRAKLMREVEEFLDQHATIFSRQGNRISQYFEMNCYNYVVKYYENNGFDVYPQNTFGGVFRYKLSAAGNPDNFSFFLVRKIVGGEVYEFEVHHNLSLECPHERDIFYTADISVIRKGAVQRDAPGTYLTKRSYCKSSDLQTFFEVKHLAPFPELLFSFVGLPENLITTHGRIDRPKHLAPSLFMSGRANYHSEKIKTYLETKYSINILFNIFVTYSVVYSKRHSKKAIGTL